MSDLEAMEKRYSDFLASKMDVATWSGWEVDTSDIHPSSFAHQIDTIKWAARIGRGLIASSFGLGKTQVEIELAKLTVKRTDRQFLVVAPLGVRHHFMHIDGPRLDTTWEYVISDLDISTAKTPYLITNYERVRDGNINPDKHNLGGCSLDEGAVLRSLGSKTYDVFSDVFAAVPYRWVATATPSPNNYKEILGYADFLNIMDRGEALTRFFQRNVDKAGDLTLIPSQEKMFWLWVASWALFIFKPSDLGYPNTGYELPKLNVHYHRSPIDYSRDFGIDSWGQHRMFPDAGGGIQQAMAEKRETLQARLNKAKEIIDANPDNNYLLWHHLEAERKAIETQIPDAVTVYGSQAINISEQRILDFTAGKFRIFATKPQIAGAGCNFQYHCSDAIFLGVDYKFHDIIQAIHRIYRFQQDKEVNLHFIYAESEDSVIDSFKRKWNQHDDLVENMRNIIKKYGLTHYTVKDGLKRNMMTASERTEERGTFFTAVKNDCTLELFELAKQARSGNYVI